MRRGDLSLFSRHLIKNFCRTSTNSPETTSLVVTSDPGSEEISIVPAKERFKINVRPEEPTRLVPVPPKPAPRRLPPLPTVSDVLKLYRIRASKHLSQNFLLNQRVVNKFVSSARIREGCHVVEIGPGPGNVTRAILERNPKELFVIEKDRRFLPLLEQLADAASPGQLKIILGDAMDYSLSNLFPEECKVPWDEKVNNEICFIGNLPFSVAIPLLIRWLRQIAARKGPFEYGRVPLTLTFQKEVAFRLNAPVLSHWRSRISVMTQTFCHVEEKFIIKGASFVPPPDVDVGVVTLIPRRVNLMPPQMDFSTYEKFVRTLFNFRQQTLDKALSKLFPPSKNGFVGEMLRQSAFRAKDMPIMLSAKEIAYLAKIWFAICQQNPGLIDYDFRARKKQPEVFKEMFSDDE